MDMGPLPALDCTVPRHRYLPYSLRNSHTWWKMNADFANDNDILVRDDADATELKAHHLDGVAVQLLKKATDGHTILIPQPNEDPKNPLNWSARKKWGILLSVSLAAVRVTGGNDLVLS